MKEIKTLFKSVFAAPPWNEDWSDEEQLDNYLRDLMEVRTPLIYGLYDGEILAGVSIGNIRHWCGGTEYFIEELCLARDYQGRGLGREFFALIEDELKKRNLNMIYLMTDRNKPAYEFYKKLGFGELSELASFFKEF